MLEHGGRIRAAAGRHGIPVSGWVDLSTGISPWPRAPSAPATTVWQRLPESGDGLDEAAARYYGSRSLLATPGSQAAIQSLPYLRPPARVAVTPGSYAEHAAAWAAAGHHVDTVADAALPEGADRCDVLVVVNPDNPTGRRLDPATLLALHTGLARHCGWLVVDEAFIDPHPGESLAPLAGMPGLVVLRSVGKFFGLAGIRLGFAGLPEGPAAALAERLGPWAVSHPARHAGAEALADRDWQGRHRERLAAASARLDTLLRWAGLPPAGGTALFRYCPTPRAGAIAEALAVRGILVRHFDAPPALRFGLPGTEAGWQRLEAALPAAVATEGQP